VALVVGTPGLSIRTFDPLCAALQDAGVDCWVLELPPAAQDPNRLVAEILPAATARWPQSRLVVVGVGLGGTLAAEAIAGGHLPQVDALALLGAPLEIQPTALTNWLATWPVPATGLSPDDLRSAQWKGQGVLPLLLGEDELRPSQVSAPWLRTLGDWVRSGHRVDLREVSMPIWVGVGGLDNLAPPESVRPWLGSAKFVRFGQLRLDAREFDHLALLNGIRPLDAVASWVAHTPLPGR
jgi:pimeloyl-ACP methyl ester carboxylesterase